MNRYSIIPVFVLFLAGASAAAQTVTTREVLTSGDGPQRLGVDAALIAASADGSLDELRLRNRAGREIPYLLVKPAITEGSWHKGRMLALAPTRETSGFELDLGGARTTGRLGLRGLPAPFLKRCRLEGSGDRVRWTELIAEGTLFSLPDEQLHQLELGFPAGEYRYLRVTWDDRMSQKLPLPEAGLVYLPPKGELPLPAVIPVDFERQPGEPGVSQFRLRLPGRHLPIRAVLLAVGEKHLLREARVSQAALSEGALAPMVLGRGMLRRVLQDEVTASTTRIEISEPTEPELVLRVEDGDNPPLDLKGVFLELSPLPWIYFETEGEASLTATVGDGAPTKPRYDLEALREQLDPALLPEARWGAIQSAVRPTPVVSAPQVDPGPGGAVDRAAFQYHRPVPKTSPGLVALLLDAEVLAGSPTLRDLRIADDKDRQIQYLLETREEPIELPLSIVGAGTKEGVSTHVVELPFSKLRNGRLVLETSARVFERRVTVLEEIPVSETTPPGAPGPGRENKPSYRISAETTWRCTDPDRDATPLVLPLLDPDGNRLLIRIDEGDNSPLPLLKERVRLLLPKFRLRFFHPGTELTLLFGGEKTSAPRYDLALLAPRLQGVEVRELSLLPGEPVQVPPPVESPVGTNWIFWGVLIFAVIALLGLLARLLRGG